MFPFWIDFSVLQFVPMVLVAMTWFLMGPGGK